MCLSGYCIGNVKEKQGRKPRSKREQKMLDMCAKLPPLTKAQREYQREHVFDKVGYYWKRSGMVWCQCCGHLYRQDHSMLAVSLDVDDEQCPHCGAHLHLKHWMEKRWKTHTDTKLFTIVTTFDGWQVFRTFEAERVNVYQEPTAYTINEVYQNWMDATGREIILSRSYTRSPFHFSWKYGTPFKIAKHNKSANGYYVMDDVYDTTGNYFYPRMRVLPVIKRNGWQKRLSVSPFVSPLSVMRALLMNNRVEMLAKTRQYELLFFWVANGFYLLKGDYDKFYLHAIRIANRNHYVVKDAGLWYDMLQAQTYLGIDTHNAHYVCPKNLFASHDYWVERERKKKEREELERKKREIISLEDEYKKEKGKYFGICFGDDHIMITVIGSVAEMAEEGEKMHHCVFYNEYYKKKDSLILSAKTNEGQRLETVEVNLKSYTIVQSRGVQNKPSPQHNRIVELVRNNMAMIKKVS